MRAPTAPSQQSLESPVITRVAMLIALLVAASVPLAYWLTSYRGLSDALSFKAQIKAAAMNSLISDTPDLWMYAENRMQGVISRIPVPLDEEFVEVFDAGETLLASAGQAPPAPRLSRSHDLFDAGQKVGHVSVSSPLRPLLISTAWSSLLGLYLGTLVFGIMRILPMRALRRATSDLVAEKERAQATLRSISDAVITVDADGRLREANPAAVAIFEADSLEHLRGRPILDFISPEFQEAFVDLKERVFKGDSGDAVFQTLGFKGGRRWLETLAVPLTVSDEPVLLAVGRDVSERHAAEAEIRTLAFHDQLTGLPNRRYLMNHLGKLTSAGPETPGFCALLMLDLDNFKGLNDTLGHDVGDRLLCEVGDRLGMAVRKFDTVGRLGGDEFVIILENLSPQVDEASAQAEIVARKIINQLNRPYHLGPHTHRSTPSIGITIVTPHAGTVDEYLKQADLAMYQAKAAGRNTLRFFDPSMQTAVLTRVAQETSLRDAVEHEQLLLHYQAQVVGDESRIRGAEVLVRWQHPTRGMVSPAEFIPLAEDSGLILPIGRWVLMQACRQLAIWAKDPALCHLTISVNISALQFRQPRFAEEIKDVLAETDADPGRLRLELTESMMVDNIEDIIAKMSTLQAIGIGFALDDFGTGYSSLSYLKRLPLVELKIDQGFVRDILVDHNDAAIAKMVIALSESMGLEVVAEGVETEAHRRFLVQLGCNAHQGYLFSRPLPLADFEQLARRRPCLHPAPVHEQS